MTVFPEPNESLTALLRSFMAMVRKLVLAEGPDAAIDPMDRILAAITVALGAIAIAWPKGRKLPGIASWVASIARQLWSRRSWWAT